MARKNDSPVSPTPELVRYSVATNPGIDRTPLNQNDSQEYRNLAPWFHKSFYLPPPQGQPSWTAAGPPRLELHMGTFRLRRLSGKYGQDQEGMHSNIVRPLLPNRSKMQAGKQNFLTIQRYTGQSYSETTKTVTLENG